MIQQVERRFAEKEQPLFIEEDGIFEPEEVKVEVQRPKTAIKTRKSTTEQSITISPQKRYYLANHGLKKHQGDLATSGERDPYSLNSTSYAKQMMKTTRKAEARPSSASKRQSVVHRSQMSASPVKGAQRPYVDAPSSS